VGESVAHPEMYYENNLVGTINLYKAMKEHGCKKVLLLDRLLPGRHDLTGTD